MSHYNVKPIRLDFKPSRLLVGILVAAVMGACLIVICMPLDELLKIALCLTALFAASYHILDKGLLRLPNSCIRLVVDEKGKVTVGTGDGTEYEVKVLASSFVASYLTILNYRIEGKFRQRSILLLPDNVDAEAFRQFRVWLRWSRHAT